MSSVELELVAHTLFRIVSVVVVVVVVVLSDFRVVVVIIVESVAVFSLPLVAPLTSIPLVTEALTFFDIFKLTTLTSSFGNSIFSFVVVFSSANLSGFSSSPGTFVSTAAADAAVNDGHRDRVEMAFGMGQLDAFSSEIVNVGKLMSFFSNSLISK